LFAGFCFDGALGRDGHTQLDGLLAFGDVAAELLPAIEASDRSERNSARLALEHREELVA
jgi:hypothetical protein